MDTSVQSIVIQDNRSAHCLTSLSFPVRRYKAKLSSLLDVELGSHSLLGVSTSCGNNFFSRKTWIHLFYCENGVCPRVLGRVWVSAEENGDQVTHAQTPSPENKCRHTAPPHCRAININCYNPHSHSSF